MIVGYGFELLGLHRISLQVYAFNPRARHVYEKVGFIAEGVLREELRYRYESGFMTALNKLATPGRQVNVLTHMLGHFSEQLEATARTEILEVIEDHRRGIVPLIVPLTLIRHYVRLLKVEYLSGQTYLDPHPRELMLRNRV